MDAMHKLGPPLTSIVARVLEHATLFASSPLVRTGKAEMKYIIDYPSEAGSLTRLHGSSGQGGTDPSQEEKKNTSSVTEPQLNEFPP